MGTNGQSAVPELLQIAADPTVALYAGTALVFVAPSEAEKLAEEWLADTNRSVKFRGTRLRGEIVNRNEDLH